MPSVPIEMPSETPIVLNRMPTSPAACDALLHLGGQVQQVHVARVALEPHAGDADLRLLHVVFRHAGGVEHGLRGALRFGLRDLTAVFVELRAPIELREKALKIVEQLGRYDKATYCTASGFARHCTGC